MFNLREQELNHAYICMAFYSGLVPAQDVLLELGFKYMKSSKPKDQHEWIMYRDNGHIFLLNRGTDEPRDWFTNFLFRKDRTPWGKIHRGFHEAFEYISYELFCLKNFDVVYVGHSKGAAISAVCSVALGKMGHTHALLWGMPRVGNLQFKEVFNSKVQALRVVNLGDPVPYTPILNYFHVGHKEIRKNNAPMLKKHFMSNYIRSHPDFILENAPRHIRVLLS